MNAKERQQFVRETVTNPDFHLSAKDILRHVYYWYRAERAMSKRYKYSREASIYIDKLNDDLAVFRFRKEMQDQL